MPRVFEYARATQSLVIEEFGLSMGTYRADVALIGERLIAYEIKSDSDTLSRLPKQAACYNAIFDEVWLVSSPRHIRRALDLIPSWWGVLELPPGSKLLTEIRVASENPGRDLPSLASLLWRDEAIEELTRRGLTKGLARKPRRDLWAQLATLMPLDELRTCVSRTVRARPTPKRAATWHIPQA